MYQQLINYLSDFITPERLHLFNKIIENRTDYITVVLEDIYQAQNASAVLRTCDCFGVQNVHIIENRNTFKVSNDVALGSSKWLTLNSYNEEANNTLQAINTLRNKGYRIIATTPHEDNDIDLYNFDVKAGKFALFFGSEMPGISDIIKNEADEFLKIPMYGFTESFNISVSVAIILSTLTQKTREDNDILWQLNKQQKEEIVLQWMKNTIRSYDQLVQRFNDNKK